MYSPLVGRPLPSHSSGWSYICYSSCTGSVHTYFSSLLSHFSSFILTSHSFDTSHCTSDNDSDPLSTSVSHVNFSDVIRHGTGDNFSSIEMNIQIFVGILLGLVVYQQGKRWPSVCLGQFVIRLRWENRADCADESVSAKVLAGCIINVCKHCYPVNANS